MSNSSKLNEVREQAKACHQGLIELETRAGIAEAAEKLRAAPPNYFGIYDAAERYSDEQRELEEAEAKFHQQRTTRRIRDLYFGVPDAKLRWELIKKDREEGSLALRYWQQELSEAAAKLETARSTHRHWWVWASVWGIGLLGLGFYLFGVIGALGGLLVAYLSGRRMEHEALRARDGAVADADRGLKEAEETWNDYAISPKPFRSGKQRRASPIPKTSYALCDG
jgi:hypothetical protein